MAETLTYRFVDESPTTYKFVDQQSEPAPQEPGIMGFMAENRVKNAEIMRQAGFGGGGIPKLAYDVGGKVTDVTGSPVAGGVSNFLINAIPAFLTSFRLGPPESLLSTPAKAMMQKAVKPNISDLESGAADKAMSTMLQEGIKGTRGGMIKASQKANEAGQQVKEAIANSNATVNVVKAASPLRETYQRAMNQVNPNADMQAVRNTFQEFIKSPHVAGKMDIPVQVAQKIKSGTYQSLADKYGEIGSASTEAQKAIARGLREQIAQAVPEAVAPLSREAALRNVMDVAGPKAMIAGNRNLGGLAMLRLDDPRSAIGFWADRLNWLQAQLAQELYAAGRPELFSGPALLGSGNAPALLEQLRQRQQAK